MGKFLHHFRNIYTIKYFQMKKLKEVMTQNYTHALDATGSSLLQKNNQSPKTK